MADIDRGTSGGAKRPLFPPKVFTQRHSINAQSIGTHVVSTSSKQRSINSRPWPVFSRWRGKYHFPPGKSTPLRAIPTRIAAFDRDVPRLRAVIHAINPFLLLSSNRSYFFSNTSGNLESLSRGRRKTWIEYFILNFARSKFRSIRTKDSIRRVAIFQVVNEAV